MAKRSWTAEEDAFLDENFGRVSARKIAEHLNRTVPAVNARSRRHCSKENWGKNINCTDEQKREIIRLYVEEKRGKQHIAKLHGVSDGTIGNWLKFWGIPSWDRQTIQKVAMGICGPTRGFLGRTHSKESRVKTSLSGKKSYETNPREPKNNSRSYKTVVGVVLGTWEVAYLQRLREENEFLPKLVRTRLTTPYGTYKPDFEFPDRYIEIKSPYTFALGKGQLKTLDSNSNILQMKKLKYISKHVKHVEIVVLPTREAVRLFKRASQNGGVLV